MNKDIVVAKIIANCNKYKIVGASNTPLDEMNDEISLPELLVETISIP